MLATVGVASVAELVDRAVPESIRDRVPLDLPAGLTEAETLAGLRGLADRNQVLTSLIGQGYSGTITPPVIQRNVLEDPAWYTAYTPYQPEISQGRLEALLNFQTMVSDLTAMDLANASLLDEATAAAEAMTMLRRVNPKAGDAFFVDAECHPQTIDVVRTRAEPLGIDVVVGVPEPDLPGEGVFGVLLQYPGTTGGIRDDRELVANLHAQGTLVAVAADLLALGAARAAGGVGRRRRRRVGAALRRAHGLRRAPRRATSPRVRSTSATSRAGSWGSRSTPPGDPRCGSRCRRVSSTSAARRRRATSAPPRCCSPTSPACTPCTTAPTASAPSPNACTGSHGRARRPRCPACCTIRCFDTLSGPGRRRRRRVCTGARTAGVNLRRVDGRHRRDRTRRDDDARDRRRASAAVRAAPSARRSGPRSSRRRCVAPPTSWCTRCSAPTTPSRRCCATCARSPTATSPSTAR